MEKKYYDIITSLIKENSKFAGCEPILEDIVQDVYNHSKVVLGSVTNEDVISAYLRKVVATSLITVPKKLNFNTRNKHRVINKVEEITNISLSVKEEPPVENTEGFEEPVVLEEDTTTSSLESEELEIEPTVETCEEEPATEEVEIIAESEPELEFEEQDVDKTLVDKMINGVTAEPEAVEDFTIEEKVETLEFFEEPVKEEVEEINDFQIEETINETVEELSFLEDAPALDIQEETTVEPFEFETTEFETIELAEEAVIEEYNVPTFDCFSYEPEAPSFDKEDICSELQEFDSKHPEKQILRICSLKYKEHLSVSEIAENLSISEEVVLDTLNDIIELVKD